MSLMPGVDFEAIKAAGLENLIEINPVTGNQMYHTVGNDVLCVVEVMGGSEAVASELGVEVIEVEHWIDDHYVPARFAEKIQAMTGWSVLSIQVAPYA